MNINALNRLESLLEQLAVDAKRVDAENKQQKSHYYLQDKPVFDEKLFPIVSANFIAYVKYAQERVQHLKKLLASNHNEFSDALMTQLEEQILSLITALKSNSSRHHDSEYQLNRRKRLSAQKQAKVYQKAVKSITMPSHQLHAKLAETHGFERRLEEMLRIKQEQLQSSKNQDTNVLQMEVLTLHQRLGRCRKAISDIEKQIEMSEKMR
ncbi:primosomal replication protein PriC [Thalassomonas sp. M1454]|uniref:primosomal replication protein PriC n=1 Tax=Thalassomonas sp. M1454 TaxID=2594477 RepID=UPI00117D7196|nr:primosomal replication protein PriC [Thalassomonas sp. M1454]TRX57238.1 hypothetical protein FNN08_06985 [Thalassomonas sp. M1454]